VIPDRYIFSSIASAALAFATVTAAPNSALADENGISFWSPGLFGSLAAVPQEPSCSPVVTNYYDPAGASGNVAASRWGVDAIDLGFAV